MKTKTSIKLFLIPAILFAVFFIFGNEARAAEYYVSPAGNDSNSGSINSPFKTIQKAADIVNPGDTVIVADGTYTGTPDIVRITRSGSAANIITFKAENKWGAKLNGQSNASAKIFGLVYPNGAVHHISIEDFDMYGAVDGIYVYNGAYAHDITIKGNKIHNMGRLVTNAPYGIDAIYIGWNNYNFTIDSNMIYTNGRLNPNTTPSATEASCTGTSDPYLGVPLCYTHDHGIYIYGHDHTIINNIFYDHLSGSDISVSGGYNSDGPNWNIVNNTFASHNPHSWLVGQVVIWTAGGGNVPTNITFQNNIFYNPPQDTGIFTYITGSHPDYALKNNIVYGATKILKAYGTLTGVVEIGNIIGQDPKFVDFPNKNFHLLSGSPTIDKGIPAGINYDADGNLRDSAPDIGAYEYVSGSTDTTPPAAPSGLTVQ